MSKFGFDFIFGSQILQFSTQIEEQYTRSCGRNFSIQSEKISNHNVLQLTSCAHFYFQVCELIGRSVYK